MTGKILLLGITAFGLSAHAQVQYEQPVVQCPTAKEFITTMEYLRDRPTLGLSEQEIRKVSTDVAAGCAGAAERFTEAFETLSKTEAGPRGSLQLAQELAKKSNSYTRAFIEIFKKSYLAEDLDLDYLTSLKMARSLSVDYSGDPDIAVDDFLRLVKFCSSDKWVGLSKPQCGVIAGRVVKSAEAFKKPIAPIFEKTFEFVVSEKGPTPNLVHALKIAEDIVAIGPEAADNFIMAYRYALSDAGLALTAAESLKFAKTLAANAKFIPAESLSEDERLPASN